MSKPRGRAKLSTRKVRPGSSEQNVGQRDVMLAWAMIRGGVIALIWLLGALALSTRTHQVMGYTVLRPLTPALEPVGADLSVLVWAMLLMLPWLWLRHDTYLRADDQRVSKWLLGADAAVLAASFPYLLSIVEIFSGKEFPRLFWEPLLLAGATGLGYFGVLTARSGLASNSLHRSKEEFVGFKNWRLAIGVSFICACVGVWWLTQAEFYHASFMLGFNDFGHFAQRIANTANGNGLLLETPVLPVFWDHFNPGLLLLVPFWILWPDESLFFALQAFAMAASGALIYRIAKQLKFSAWLSVMFCCGWLAQPAAGQMNIAYTYGWHPITLAIPLLLLTISWTFSKRYALASITLILAMSMEEGVIAVVAIWALVSAARLRMTNRLADVTSESTMGLPERTWWCVGALSALAFIIVFKFSGLAEFQTGRFVALGDSLPKVVLSPVLRPEAFWGQLIRPQSAYLLLCLFLPLGIVSVWRVKSMLIAILPPLGVLLVWDHAPATSLAFQYSSSLLPLFWFSAMEGARQLPSRYHQATAAAAVVTGFALSLFVGQLPFSRDSLVEVKAATYAPTKEMRRVAGEDDSIWLIQELDEVRSQDTRVLATGRIAAHLVGCRDIETVGQFMQRRPQLEKIPERPDGLGYYDWIVLDLTESFQQSKEQTDAIFSEAASSGFVVHSEKYEVVFLRRAEP